MPSSVSDIFNQEDTKTDESGGITIRNDTADEEYMKSVKNLNQTDPDIDYMKSLQSSPSFRKSESSSSVSSESEKDEVKEIVVSKPKNAAAKRSMFAKRTTSTLGDIMFGEGKAPKLDAKQILTLLRKQLKKLCQDELLKWGKCNELLTNAEMDKKKEEMAE